MNIQFGSEKNTKVIDDNGSTVTNVIDYNKGIPKALSRNKYEIRTRVYTPEEEREQYLSFSYEIEKDPTMLDPAFMIERSVQGNKNGYYYVVRCYTRLQY